MKDVEDGCDSSSSTDSQSLSSSLSIPSFPPKILFVLRNLTVGNGLTCRNACLVMRTGAGLRSLLIVCSSIKPTSVNIERRRPRAAAG